MRPPNESKNEKFHRLAESRANKILAMLRLLGNLSATNVYSYTPDEVAQVFTALEAELARAKMRFQQPPKIQRNRFSLSASIEGTASEGEEAPPSLDIKLPDGTCLRAVGYEKDDYPSVNIYWDNGVNQPSDAICFVEYNPDKPENQRVCIGAYCMNEEDTQYYAPYITVKGMQYE